MFVLKFVIFCPVVYCTKRQMYRGGWIDMESTIHMYMRMSIQSLNNKHVLVRLEWTLPILMRYININIVINYKRAWDTHTRFYYDTNKQFICHGQVSFGGREQKRTDPDETESQWNLHRLNEWTAISIHLSNHHPTTFICFIGVKAHIPWEFPMSSTSPANA